MTIRTLRPTYWTTFAAIAILVVGIGLVGFVSALFPRHHRRQFGHSVAKACPVMMSHTGGMMWGMGLSWLIVIIGLVLAAAALLKYLSFAN